MSKCPFDDNLTAQLQKTNVILRNLFDRMEKGNLKRFMTDTELDCFAILINAASIELKFRLESDHHGHPGPTTDPAPSA